MNRLLKSHPEATLIFLASLLLSILVVSFIWSLGVMISALGASLAIPRLNQPPAAFDLEGARSLGLDTR